LDKNGVFGLTQSAQYEGSFLYFLQEKGHIHIQTQLYPDKMQSVDEQVQYPPQQIQPSFSKGLFL
jgi:hypothetical protein